MGEGEIDMGSLYLAISDGMTTCTIADGAGGATDYQLRYGTWSPRVAKPRTSQLAGRGPYEDVVESMMLTIKGDTAAEVYDALQALSNLLDQAVRWASLENVAAVKLLYSPPGATESSAAHPLQATISDYELVLPDNFNTGDTTITGVQLKVTRAGQWLLDETAVTVGTHIENGGIMLIEFDDPLPPASNYLPDPIKLVLTNVNLGNYGRSGFVLYGNGEKFIAGAEMYLGANVRFTEFTDTGKFSFASDLLRYTPIDTTYNSSEFIDEFVYQDGLLTPPTGFAAAARLVAVFVNARNNSSVASYQVFFRLAMQASGGTVYYRDTNPVVIPPYESAAAPQWVFVGLAALEQEINSIAAVVRADQVDGSLDMDRVMLLNVTDPQTRAIGLLADGNGNGVSTVTIDHQLLTKPQPAVLEGTLSTPYSGDAVLGMNGSSSDKYVCLLMTGGDTTADRWRQVRSGALLSNTWTITKTRSTLVPI